MKKTTVLLTLLLLFAVSPLYAYKVIVKIPATATLADQNAELQLYINEEVPATEETPAVVSVYIKYKQSGKASYILTSNPQAEAAWKEMAETKAPAEVTHFDIPAIEKAVFVPGTPNLILVEGCPDARNVCTYLVNFRTRKVKQLPSNEGLLRFDPQQRYIYLSDYRYHPEGGRYSVEKVLTYDGKFVEEHKLAEE